MQDKTKLITDYNKFMKSKVGSFRFNKYNSFGGYINPTIIEEREMNVAVMDVFSRLMMDRIVFIGTPIDDDVSNIITSQLLYLNSISEEDINVYINSPGGHVYSGFGIYDTMHLIKPSVNTLVTGLAASMGAILLLAGEKRSSLKHSRIMFHQPLSGVEGQASDIEIVSKEILTLREEMYDIVVEKTNMPIEDVIKMCDRDTWLKSSKALELGIIHEIK